MKSNGNGGDGFPVIISAFRVYLWRVTVGEGCHFFCLINLNRSDECVVNGSSSLSRTYSAYSTAVGHAR
jgi:hypothetical protein